MTSLKHSPRVGITLAALLVAATGYAFETDLTSNDVFDLYFFGNGEVAQLGENLSGFKEVTGLDTQQVAGWVDWTGTAPEDQSSQWTQEQKNAVVEAVSAWTDVIQNAYDPNGDGRRKLRIGLFLDDASRVDSLMDPGMNGYASYALTTTDNSNGNVVNTYSVVEWVWRENGATYVRPGSMSTGAYWNYNLLPSGETCVEVAIVINPEVRVYSDGTMTTQLRSAEDIKKIVMHELGHAMGVDSKMFSASESYPQTELVTTWDSLVMVGDNTRVVTLDDRGRVVYSYANFKELCAEGWSLYETWYNTQNGEEKLLRLQNEAGETVNLLVTAGTNVEGNSLVHLLGELGASEYDDVLGPTGLQSSVFSDIDLTALRMLGWEIAIPEPSAFGLLAGLASLLLAGTRRRKR